MTNDYSVIIQNAARNDLTAIWEYVAVELKEPVTAARLLDKLHKAVISLGEMPQRHGVVRDDYLAAREIRMLPVDQYLIFYTADKYTKTVHVLRLLYGRRDWERILY